MAANKFATMLHRNTHKITVILVYAILEWILIFLLLLNFLLSFLISKFASYFGLKKPCIICCCSSLDHTLHPNNTKNPHYIDLIICHQHATYIPTKSMGVFPETRNPTCFVNESREEVMNMCPRIGTSSDHVNRLVPLEMIDSSTINHDHQCGSRDSERKMYEQDECFSVEAAAAAAHEIIPQKGTGSDQLLEKMEFGELVNSIIMAVQDLVAAATEEAQSPAANGKNIDAAATLEEEVCELQEGEKDEDDGQLSSDETKSEMFEILEIWNHELSDQNQEKESISTLSRGELGQPFEEKNKIENFSGPDISVTNNMDLEPNMVEEKKLPEKLQAFEKGEFGTQDCWNGTVDSETEFGDETLLIEKLKSELRAERKALSSLYAELEEERNAAAIAASQTMAMITRLQEEKAAMQMEAQQYQRMMEEQAEYDQEALQLLNELMIKREKEKQELENELEIYHKKVLDYETKMTNMRKKDGSARSRNSSDELSVDLNGEERDEDCVFYEHQERNNNSVCMDTVLDLGEVGGLDESLAGFEEERLSILEELKALEAKLFTLGDDDNDNEQLFEGVNPIGCFEDFDKVGVNSGFISPKEGGTSDGLSNIVNSKTNMFLTSVNEEGKIESDSSQMREHLDSKFEMVKRKLAIEEEVSLVYERLQALETDRDFLKHCVSSLNKGDKGMDLLQEILQHLRDLRTVEFHARSLCDSPLYHDLALTN